MATAALFAELTSFVSKLSQLNSYGCNANLNFNACAGRVHVTFHADLGDELNFNDTPAKKAPKPSRFRRQQRRKQAFEDARKQSESFNIKDNIQCDALLVPPTVNDGNANDPSNLLQPTSLSSQATSDEENLPENIINAEVKDLSNSEMSCENEEPWVWTPPSEEDMLLYMKEHGHRLQNSSCDLTNERLDAAASANSAYGLVDSRFMR